MRRFAYADPPYLGCASRYYGDKHPNASDFDKIETHAALVRHLVDLYPDGWALSCHVPSLRKILELCPHDVRIACWVKPFSGTRGGVRARFSWEPVIYRTSLVWSHGPQFTDHLIANGNQSNGIDPVFPGQKPEVFAAWICRILGARPEDVIDDLFPGSGAMSRAFRKPRDPESFSLDLVERAG